MLTILVNLLGLLIIFLIVWWFWLGKSQQATIATQDIIEIDVDGGIYSPATIKTEVGEKLTLRFIRHDASPCAQMVVFPELNISEELPVDKPFDINIEPQQSGTYEFTCAMGMYRGKLIVE